MESIFIVFVFQKIHFFRASSRFAVVSAIRLRVVRLFPVRGVPLLFVFGVCMGGSGGVDGGGCGGSSGLVALVSAESEAARRRRGGKLPGVPVGPLLTFCLLVLSSISASLCARF